MGCKRAILPDLHAYFYAWLAGPRQGGGPRQGDGLKSGIKELNTRYLVRHIFFVPLHPDSVKTNLAE
jgi:hypothetical protein